MGEIGYHIKTIQRGVFGEASKIAEESAEFIDAVEQGVSLMALQELSDLIGAVKGYLADKHPEISLSDLEKMAIVTARSFSAGHRKSREE